MKTRRHEKMNFAVIGCGALAMGQHIPNIARSVKTRLHTCCDLSDVALKKCQDQYGALHVTKDYRAAIADPEVEAVCVATTEKMRLPLIEAAAKAGKPVYCEKPIATTMEEAYKIRDVVKQTGIPFCIGYNRRNSPAMMEAHRIFREHMEHPKPCAWRWNREGDGRPHLDEDGTAGMMVRINDDWWSWKGWAFDKTHAPHGPMLFEMVHFTDMCNWFMSAEAAEVTALECGMLNHGVVIRYKSGELATITMCANGSFGYPKELYEMMGNGGVVVCDHMLEIRTAGIEGAPTRQTFPIVNGERFPDVGTEGGLHGWLAKTRASCEASAARGEATLDTFAMGPDKGHASSIDRFVDEIRGTGPVVCGVDDAVAATRVAFAAIRSAHEHRAISMDEV
ncbi:MAG: Gfo/Idh/MocA family oxidoreductase [Kiritimatiellae bacterium]|nr:Gfo/Idh/MocA family oxidoreductase [Kiritimatiellia bacterium]